MKTNYHKQLLQIIEQVQQQNQTCGPQKLLLHACCAPCSSYVIELLSQVFDITIFYYNPNIHPQAEYERRLNELKKFLTVFPLAVQQKVQLVCADYDPEEFFSATKVREEPQLQTEAERGERCRRCYSLRMKKSWDYAVQNGFDYFTTTLSISPHKDSEMINEIGLSLPVSTQNSSRPTKYLPADFKKNNGYLRSTQLSRQYDLWRQDYCGCIFSKNNMPENTTPSH